MAFTFAQLRHVVLVDRLGSFTAAAHDLNLSQSSVTKSVAQVENDLGYSLFDRRARGATSTEEGRDFIDRAARIVSDMDGLAGETLADRAQRSEVVRIGVAPPSIEGLMNRAVRSVLRTASEFSVQLQTMPTKRLAAQLRQGDIDVAIGPLEDLETEAAFAIESLPPLTGRLFVRKGHPMNDPGSTAAAHDFPLILPTLSPFHVEGLLRSIDPDRQGFPALHVIDSFPMIAAVIDSTDSIGLVSQSYSVTLAFRQKFDLLPDQLANSINLVIARRARWMPTPPMTRLLNAVRRYPPS